MIPPLRALVQRDTVRLIPSQYSDDGASVLARIARDTDHLQVIFDLDHATNDRLMAENNLLPGVSAAELLRSGPYYRIVNAAFCHASPTGGRFNGPDRGCWYAGAVQDTSLAEVIFHKTLALAEIDYFHDSVTYDPYLADINAEFHDIIDQPEFSACLDPASYVAGQTLAEALLQRGSAGLIYPSVRDPGGVCFAVMRPACVGNVRRGSRLRVTWSGAPDPTVTVDA